MLSQAATKTLISVIHIRKHAPARRRKIRRRTYVPSPRARIRTRISVAKSDIFILDTPRAWRISQLRRLRYNGRSQRQARLRVALTSCVQWDVDSVFMNGMDLLLFFLFI